MRAVYTGAATRYNPSGASAQTKAPEGFHPLPGLYVNHRPGGRRLSLVRAPPPCEQSSAEGQDRERGRFGNLGNAEPDDVVLVRRVVAVIANGRAQVVDAGAIAERAAPH